MRNTAGLPQGTMKWNVTPLGGGGFCTHVEVANDGTVVTQSDVFNSYKKAPGDTAFTPMFRADTLPTGEYGPNRPKTTPTYQDNSHVGGYATAISPTDSNVIYGTYNGFWWRSSDQGGSWTKIGGPYVTFANNGIQRLWTRKAVVDPQNPNVAMLGTEEGKVVYVLDGLTPNVLTVPLGTTQDGVATPHLVAVDPTSPVVGGVTQTWAYSVFGTGIYESTTGPGGPYTLLAGSPPDASSLQYDAAGRLWALRSAYTGDAKVEGYIDGTTLTVISVDYGTVEVGQQLTGGQGALISDLGTGTGGPGTYIVSISQTKGSAAAPVGFPLNASNIYVKPAGGSFGKLQASLDETPWRGLAVNPANTNQVVVIDDSGYFNESLDGGVTWLGHWFQGYPETYSISQFATGIGWFHSGAGRFFPADLAFHPSNGRLYASCGVGVRWCVPPTDFNSNWEWYDDTLGIENMEIATPLVPPGGVPIYALHDFGFFRIDYNDRWVNTHGIPDGTGDESAWFVDYAPEDPSYLVGTAAYWHNSLGYSTDYGKTWNLYPAQHPSGYIVQGGVTVAASKNDLYFFPENNWAAVESHDGGNSWRYMDVPGIPQEANFTGSISDNTLTVTSMNDDGGVILVGHKLLSLNGTVLSGTHITGQISGTTGGVGTYSVDVAQNSGSIDLHTRIVGSSGWGFSLWNPQFVFCSDKTNGDVYAYNYGPDGNTGAHGLYYRKFGTSQWVWQYVGKINPDDATGTGKMMAVPGRTGELLFQGNVGHGLYHSTDKGVTWTQLPNVDDMWTFCFGKEAPGQTYPSVYINGSVGGVPGIWRSDDGMNTWTYLIEMPMNHLGTFGSLDASKDEYGSLEAGSDHGGAVQGRYQFKLTLAP